MEPVLKITLLSDSAYPPSRKNKYAAGYDLRSPGNYDLPPKAVSVIPLDILAEPPPGTYVKLALRSGFSVRNLACITAGVGDPDYRGNISAVLINLGDHLIRIKRGESFAQMVLEKYCSAQLVVDGKNMEDTSVVRGLEGLDGRGKFLHGFKYDPYTGEPIEKH